jgi:alpha-glucosidase
MHKTNQILVFFLFLSPLFFPVTVHGVETVTLSSPSKILKLKIFPAQEGLHFTLSGPKNLEMTIDAFGFETDNGIILTGSSIGKVRQTSVNDGWKPVYGEREVIPDRYRQAIITLSNSTGKSPVMEIICRLYDEGLAFRYRIIDTLSGNFIIKKERTTFRFEGNYETWASSRAQSIIEKTTLDKITSEVERPLLVKHSNSSWLALGEAGLVDFARMKFLADPEKTNTILSQLSGEVDPDAAGYITPWRYVMVAGSPGELLENNFFILNLNEPDQIDDTSWIKPGKVIREVTLTTQGGLACVDFAAKHRMEYVEFDAGWYGPETDPRSDAKAVNVDPKRSTGPLDLQRVIGYAKEKNIGILLYVNHLALERQLDTILPLYQSWGVKGVKYGFVNVGSQKWTAWLHGAVRKAAQYRLMVDIHDEYRPTGYSRTFPNLMTQEGIRGDEESPSTEHSLNTLFTRMIAGAGDNTNCFFAPRVSKAMGGKCAQMAKAIMIYSPWQFIFWYDRPEGSPSRTGGAGSNEDYIKELPELGFFETLPTVWDDTRVLEGMIGQYATIARKKGDVWYVGSLTANNDREVRIPLSFLRKKKGYEAVMYSQDEKERAANEVKTEKIPVTSETVISRRIAANSGLAIIIRKK